MARQECNRDFGLTFTQEPMVDPVGGLSEGGSGSSVGAPELQREQSLIHLGQIIRRERLAQKITLRNLAERTGMSTAYLVALEKASNPKTGNSSDSLTRWG